MRDIDFKKAGKNDWREIMRIEKEVATPLFAPCKDEEDCKRYLSESEVYFITVNGDLIGTISFKPFNQGGMIINGLTVLPSHRGLGIAKKSIKKLLEKLSDEKVVLYTHPQNTPALIIYLKLGFVIVDWKENVFGDGQPRLFLKLKK